MQATTIERLERDIQRSIELAIGAEPDFLMLRNNNGHAVHTKEDGSQWHMPYGLGVGSPDLVGILAPSGKWVCLEIKKPGEKPTPKQTQCHAVWRRFGAFVAVVTSTTEAKAALARARSGASA